MLTLTRPYRQGLATLFLLVTSVVPTVIVTANVWRIARPGHVRDQEVEISRAIGLRVSLDAVRYPRPGQVVYTGVVVRRDERDRGDLAEVVRAEEILIRRVGGESILGAKGLELRGDSPSHALRRLQSTLPRLGLGAGEKVSFSADSCRVSLGDGIAPIETRDLAGSWEVVNRQPTFHASYRVPSASESAPATRCELTFVPHVSGGPVGTTLVIKTMEGPPLDARVLQVFFDSGAWLGQDAKVWGTIRLTESNAREWSGEFEGELIDLDLETLVAERFPGQRLHGKARLVVRSARWSERPGQGFGWSSAEGELSCGRGSIGVELLRSLASQMRFRLAPKYQQLDSRLVEVGFRSLGLGFRLESDGQIKLAGGCGKDFAPDVVLVGSNQLTPLAYAPSGVANVRGLLKTLFPGGGESLVPVTAESQVLQRYLPLPSGRIEETAHRLNAQ